MTWAQYALFDPARAPAQAHHLERLGPAAACLFEGRLHPAVKAASPHLVEWDDSDPLMRQWGERGWGDAWGVLIRSRAPLAAVRRRLRHFTQAKLPSGEGPVLFRFWDPRVLRVYLPLVEPDQLQAWFTDIDAYVMEDDDGPGAGAMAFTLGPHGLVTREEPPLR